MSRGRHEFSKYTEKVLKYKATVPLTLDDMKQGLCAVASKHKTNALYADLYKLGFNIEPTPAPYDRFNISCVNQEILNYAFCLYDPSNLHDSYYFSRFIVRYCKYYKYNTLMCIDLVNKLAQLEPQSMSLYAVDGLSLYDYFLQDELPHYQYSSSMQIWVIFMHSLHAYEQGETRILPAIDAIFQRVLKHINLNHILHECKTLLDIATYFNRRYMVYPNPVSPSCIKLLADLSSVQQNHNLIPV